MKGSSVAFESLFKHLLLFLFNLLTTQVCLLLPIFLLLSLKVLIEEVALPSCSINILLHLVVLEVFKVLTGIVLFYYVGFLQLFFELLV